MNGFLREYIRNKKPTMDSCLKIGYNAVIYLFYDMDSKIYYDEDGLTVYNIFELLKPTDILLFQADNTNNVFISRNDRNTIVEIIYDEVV